MSHLEQSSRRRAGILALAVAGALASTVALADNPHCAGEAEARAEGAKLRFQAKLAGLGRKTRVRVIINAEGTTDVVCGNPGGNGEVPGQSGPVELEQRALVIADMAGNLSVDVLTDDVEPDPSACPNEKWTRTATNTVFHAVTAVFLVDGQREAFVRCSPGAGTRELECECLD